MNNKNLGKVLIGMGAVTLITTMVDFYSLIFPTNIKAPQWVFGVTQAISDISVMPALAMVFILIGIMFAKDKLNEGALNIVEKSTGILSLLFGIGLAVCAFMYAISAGGVENLAVENLKATNTNAKAQLSKFYEANKAKIDEAKYNEYVDKMDQQMMVNINQTNSGIQKSTFKTMLNLGFFSLLNLYIFIRIFELMDFFRYKVLKLKKPVNS
jgi:hypothetical protein